MNLPGLSVMVALVIVGCSSPPTSFAPGSLAPPTPAEARASSRDEQGESGVSAAGVEDQSGYVLVWADEFDYEGHPDPRKWTYDVGGHGWGNQELQYYTEGENVAVRDGVMVIEARREPRGGRDYTSTRIVSRRLGDWLYGRVEVRAKLPAGRGTWPAIWMLPTDWAYGTWPASGEIDIMEHVGYEPGMVHGTVHTDRYNHMKGTQQGGSIQVPDAAEEFHVYSVEWSEERIAFFVDGEQYYRFTPFVNLLDPSFREWPFDRRFHLLMNIAVGGSWGGAQGVDDSIWPVSMEIDYVRVYQDPSISAVAEN